MCSPKGRADTQVCPYTNLDSKKEWGAIRNGQGDEGHIEIYFFPLK